MAASRRVSADERDHTVQFYGRDDDLIDNVATYLVDAIEAGEVAVVIGRPAHSFAFEARLVAAGIDITAARAGGDLLVLDAEETMRRFLVADRPDPDGFQSVIGEVIQRAARPGRMVRVYGEMVALLWEAGHVNAAIELETLWNELDRQLPFSLFCAYSMQSVVGEEHLDAFAEVCRLHSTVVGLPVEPSASPAARAESKVVRSFVGTLNAPRDARQFVMDTLRQWGKEDVISDAALVVTELATNAVLHAQSEFTVVITPVPGAVRISVRDGDMSMPTQRDSPPEAFNGRGLGLVSALASHWAVELVPGGKEVWAELRV